MSNTPSVSIVLPTYNAADFISKTLASVFQQSFTDWELVLVDDGSVDQTLEVVRTYEEDPRVRVFAVENGGEASARNFGYSQISPLSDYVLFLDHDDVLFPDSLDVLKTLLEAQAEAVGSYGSGFYIDEHDALALIGHLEEWCRVRRRFVQGQFVQIANDEPTSFDALAYKCCISSMSSCLLRKKFLPSQPLFKANMRTGSADLHLYLRLAHGRDFLFVDRPVYQKRIHANNITGNQDAIDQSILNALKDIAKTVPLTPDQYAAISASYRQKLKARARVRRSEARRALRTGRFKNCLWKIGDYVSLSAQAYRPLLG